MEVENQMTVDEQLDRMNEVEFKAFLEACTHKTKKTLEQEAMFSQLDRPAKPPEEALPPLTTTKHSSSLQSLSQSHGSNSRKNSQVHHNTPSKSGTTSSSTSGNMVGPTVGVAQSPSHSHPSNNNTHHHPPHLNSSFSSTNSYNSVNSTNCTSTSLSSTGSSSGGHHEHLSCNSQHPQHVNCNTTMVNNSHHHLYTPCSNYSTSSSLSHTEEDTTATSGNSNPNNTSYSTTTFTATAPLASRQYRYHSQPTLRTSTTTIHTTPTTSSSISVNFNLKRPPPPKSVIQNHIEVTATATLPSPYFFNARTAGQDDDDNEDFLSQSPECSPGKQFEGFTVITSDDGDPNNEGNAQRNSGRGQVRNDYGSMQGLTGTPVEFGSYSSRTHRTSPRSSRSGTPVHGEAVSASLNVTRRVGAHGGTKNKKVRLGKYNSPKETLLTPSDLGPYLGDRYNLEELVSYITGEPEKSTQNQIKKPKKKTKRKETLSKSHSLDENTLGTEVNPSIETRSVSSNVLEHKSDDKGSSEVTTTTSLDLSTSSTTKLETLRSHSSSEFITVTNRKKNKGLKGGDSVKSKVEVGQQEDFTRANHDPQVVQSSALTPSRSDGNSPEEVESRRTIAVNEEFVPKSMLNSEPWKSEDEFKSELVTVDEPPKREVAFKQDFVLQLTKKEKEDNTVTNKELEMPSLSDPMPVFKPQFIPIFNPESPSCSSQKEPYAKLDTSKKQEGSLRRQQHSTDGNQSYGRKYNEPQRRQEIGRRSEPPARQDHGRRERETFVPANDPMPRRPQFLRHDSEPRQFPSRYRDREPNPESVSVSKSSSLSSDSLSDQTPVKEEAVKFCGVNFENKGDIMLQKPNVNVEFGFGVTDVLTQFAKAPPPEVFQNVEVTPVELCQDYGNSTNTESSNQPIVTDEIQVAAPHPEFVQQPLKQVTSSIASDVTSLLGRHPQSGQSPPVNFLPISLPATGYQMSAANYYATIPQNVAVGVVQYYPGPPHMQPIQQISAPIMTAIPTQGTGTLPQQFMNPLPLTAQQHQIFHHQQQLIQQQQHPQPPFNTNIQQQPILQYQQVLLKPNTPQQQYTGTPQSIKSQFSSSAQNTAPPHPQQGYNSQGSHGGNFNYHRNTNTPRANPTVINCSPQMGNFIVQSPHQGQQQYGPGTPYLGQPSGGHPSHNYNSPGLPPAVHYSNYHRNSNSRSSHINSPGSHSYGSQSSPQGNVGSGQNYAQSHRQGTSNHNQNARSLSSNPPAATAVSMVVNPPSPEQQLGKDVVIFVNPKSNPLGQYYISPVENDDHSKHAKTGQDYMNTYTEKLNECIERGATVHRI